MTSQPASPESILLAEWALLNNETWTLLDQGTRIIKSVSLSLNSCCLQVEHLRRKENWALLEKARVIYSAGFFITVSEDSIMDCAKHAAENNKIYCMNLSAPFIMEVPPFKATLMKALPYVDFLFGNENEARTFAKSEGWSTEDVSEIALKVSKHGGKKYLNERELDHHGKELHVKRILEVFTVEQGAL